MKKYVAMYMRISLEDIRLNHEESFSISSQRRIIESYILQEPTLVSTQKLEFCDDGYTGTNFERPGFTRMMELVREGRIECIIVKDLSRLGRNYLDVGDYIEHIFPFLGVRFIAINDQYDSNKNDGKTGGIVVALHNLVNDYYSRDLSRKVKTAMHTRMLKGKFVNHVPYGFAKLPNDKHRMVLDPVTAPVVRRIFTEIIAGRSTSEVAKGLNEDGIPTPMEYKSHKRRSNIPADKTPMWTHNTVLNILKNYKYTGAMVNHTRENRHLRDTTQRIVPRSEWIITENAHEQIVSQEEYEMANNSLRKIKPYIKVSHNTSDRVYYCGLCGRKLRKTFGSDTYFSCDTPMYQNEALCRGIRWSKTDLEDVILEAYKQQLAIINAGSVQKEEDHFNSISRIDRLLRRCSALTKEIDECNAKRLEKYECYRDGSISRNDFLEAKALLQMRQTSLCHELSDTEYELEYLRSAALKGEERSEIPIAVCGSRSEGKSSPEDMKRQMYEHIQRVLILSNHEISIEWKWEDPAKVGEQITNISTAV